MCLCSLVDSIRRFIRMIGTKKKKGERQMMTRYIAVIEDHETEKKYVIGNDHASKETALGSLVIAMQLRLLEHAGGDAQVQFGGLKTCGITDNGKDTLYIEGNAFNSETKEFPTVTGYVFRVGDEEEDA